MLIHPNNSNGNDNDRTDNIVGNDDYLPQDTFLASVDQKKLDILSQAAARLRFTIHVQSVLNMIS